MTTVGPVPAVTTYPLRHRVLRPDQVDEAVPFPGDDDPRSLHVAATELDEVLAVGSILPDIGGWRVRGMATDAEHRGRGLGTLVLDRLLVHAGADPVWCHARVGAVHLYERAGFVTHGGPWHEPAIGPHVLMRRHGPGTSRDRP